MNNSTLKKHFPVGGQAVIEGVMMRGPGAYALACRRPNGEIHLETKESVPWTKQNFIFGIPFIRGVVTLIETLKLGVEMIFRSAEVALEEEKEKIGKTEFTVSFLASFLIAVALFVVLPAFVFIKLKPLIESTLLLNFIEGCVRISIFLIFLSAASFMEDMKRVFAYHGAEHKAVNLFEDLRDKMDNTQIKEQLTLENTRPFKTFHPSCGTSFLITVFIISIFVFAFLGRPSFVMRIILKLCLLPVIAGISYEIIKLASRHRKALWVNILTWPGWLLQKITTRTPDDKQVEVALTALKSVL